MIPSEAAPKSVVLALVAQNENDVLLHASRGFWKNFARIGILQRGEPYLTQVIDLLAPRGLEELTEWLQSGAVILGCALAGVGAQLRVGGEEGPNIWSHYKIPFMSFWHDHPAYNYRQHAVQSPYVLNCYHYEDHYQAWRKLFSDRNEAVLFSYGFLPTHAYKKKPWKEREAKILYIKSGINPDALTKEWQFQPPLIRDMLWFLAEKARKDRDIDLIEEVEALFRQTGLPFNNLDLSLGIVQEVDAYIRAWRSDKLVRELLSHEAVIVGGGWDYLDVGKSKAVFEPPIHPSKIIEVVPAYRLAANTNPLWRRGIHERTGRGMGAACITVTDNTQASLEAFGDLPNYVGFEWADDLQAVLVKAFAKAHEEPEFLTASPARVDEKFPPPNDALFCKIIDSYQRLLRGAKEKEARFGAGVT